MDHNSEFERLRNRHGLQSMPANPWEFRVGLGPDGAQSSARLFEVMELIVEKSMGEWPSDEEWRRLMPLWIKEKIPELTKEQTDRLLEETPQSQWDSLPWEFLSWLDAIRERGWLWWGYKSLGSEAIIVMHIGMLPERIDAFKELLRSSGMEIVSESYKGLS